MGEVIPIEAARRRRPATPESKLPLGTLAKVIPISPVRARITRVIPPRRPLADMEVRHPVAMMLNQSELIEQAADSIVAAELADSAEEREALSQAQAEALSSLSETEQEFAWEEAHERLLEIDCKEDNN